MSREVIWILTLLNHSVLNCRKGHAGRQRCCKPFSALIANGISAHTSPPHQ